MKTTTAAATEREDRMFDYMAHEDALSITTTTRAAAAERNILRTIRDLSDPNWFIPSSPDQMIKNMLVDLRTLIHQ